MKYALILCLLATSAFADEPKTVTLTEADLASYANAVQAQTAAQIAAQQAKPVLDKIKAAFAAKDIEAPKK